MPLHVFLDGEEGELIAIATVEESLKFSVWVDDFLLVSILKLMVFNVRS